MKRYLLLPLLLLSVAITQAQPVTIRICTYNVLNFGTDEDSARVAALQKVIGSIKPDILVVQEINGEAAMLPFFFAMLSPPDGLIAIHGNEGPDTDNALLRSDKVESLKLIAPPTALRNIDEFVLTIKGTPDTIHVFAAHLKAGDTDADSLDRIEEAMILRQVMDTIPAHHHRVVAGNLNVYTSSEGAYQALTQVGIIPSGEVVDPLQKGGQWHNTSRFADVMTQSPRVRQFGGGIGGGLDDRFDFVLLSPSLASAYRPDSYTTYGNDGAHFNDSINAMPNTAVDSVTAQALYDASDHLPVYLDLMFQMIPSGVEEEMVPDQMDLSERR